MLRTLLESNAAPTRRRGGMIVSIGLHTAAIALAVVATARANLGPPDIVRAKFDPPPIYTSMPPRPRDDHSLPVPDKEWRCICTVDVLPDLPVPPVKISAELPPIEDKLPPIPEEFRGEGRAGWLGEEGMGSRDGRVGSDSASIHTFMTVDRAARPKQSNPSPIYPATLRSAQLEGVVVARFVVDTSGLAEPASIEIKDTTHPLFGDAVRQALLRSRYEPAMADNRKVRQLVEQRFTFTLLR